MGRIRTKRVKMKGKAINAAYPGDFSTDFEKNKKLVGERAQIRSKKIRNVLAGYLTRLVKKADTL